LHFFCYCSNHFVCQQFLRQFHIVHTQTMNNTFDRSVSSAIARISVAEAVKSSALVVFDSRLDDLDVLYGALLPDAMGFTIDDAADALLEITRLLAETGAKRLAIVAHGEPGVVHIGAQPLNLAQINHRAGLIQEWCVEEIAVYSCEVGANAEFVRQLELLTGARVAASTTKVGAQLLGGNWNLDVAAKEVIAPFALEQVMAYAHTLVIGTNSFGYIAEATTYEAINLVPGDAGVTSVLAYADASFDTVNLGANSFNFYGTSYNQLFIGVNGLINFGSSQAGYSQLNQSLSINGLNYNKDAIAVLWDGLAAYQTIADQVLYSIQDNQLIIEWHEVEFDNDLSNSNTVTFQAILELNTALVPGDIKFNYVDLDTGNSANSNGASATIGIRRASGDPLSVSFNSLNTNVGSGKAILFSASLPTVAAPSAFTVTEDVEGNLTFVGTPFADYDSSSLTVTLSIADGSITARPAPTPIVIDLGGTPTTLTFSGTIETLNAYFTTPGIISYTTAQDNNIARTLNISVSDGVYTSSTTSTINITPDNDFAPFPVRSSVSLADIAEDTNTLTLDGATVESLFGSAFSDNDGAGVDGTFFGVAITGNASLPSQGKWEWKDGDEWTEITGVATTGALVLDKNTLIRFSPTADYNGTPGALTARLVDGSTTWLSGTGNHAVNGADGVNSGGATAVSRNSVTLTTNVIAINDAPTLTVNISPADSAHNYTEGGATSTSGLFVNAQANTHNPGNNTEATQKFKSVTLEVSNMFAGDQLKIDGELVNIDAPTTTGSIKAGTFAVDVVVNGDISEVTISRPGLDISNPLDISSYDLQTLIQGIGFRSTSDNPTNFGNKNTREIKIVEIKDNGGTTGVDSTLLSYSGTVNVIGVNDAAVFANDSGLATEGSAPINATGNVLTNDVDPDNILYVSTVNGGESIEASATFVGNYGSLMMDYDGDYTYVVDNANTLVNSLNVGSASLVDSFTYTVYEGGSSHTATLEIDIVGGNNSSVITGSSSGSITESGSVFFGPGATTTGTLISTDVDNDSDWKSASDNTTYGSYGINTAGVWTYSLDNSNASVNALNVGGTLVDTFTVSTTDGTTKSVSITINGANDPTFIFGTATGSVTESGTIASSTSTTGSLGIVDVDDNLSWQSVSGNNATYGTYGITSSGNWTYTVDNGNTLVDALNIGSTLVDTFTVTTSNGINRTVSVAINGADDAPVLSEFSTNTGNLTEASGLNNSINNDLASSQATGQVIYTDVDNTIAWNTTSKTVTTSQKGSYSVDVNGNWVYNLNNKFGDVQKLHVGQSTTDSFTISTTSGLTQTVTVVIQGGEDTPVVTNPAALSGSVTEAAGNEDYGENRIPGFGGGSSYLPGIPTVSKDVNFTDPDNTSDQWNLNRDDTNYGYYNVNAAGKWTYYLDNYNYDVRPLNNGQTLTDTFEVVTNDGTSETVTITINGTNDAANIRGQDYGFVDEAGGVANGSIGKPTATGDLVSYDDDNAFDSWTVQENVKSISGYGTYSINASGVWAYTLDNTNPDVEALDDYESLIDTFIVKTIDGTSTTVSVEIYGQNDVATITGDVNKSITEATGFDNSVGSSTITGILTLDNNSVDGWQVESDGNYGTSEITDQGVWTYTLNNNNGIVDSLQDGITLTDSFIVYNAGNTEVVTVKIVGGNDSAIITGTTTAVFTEDSGVTSTAGNNLDYTDPDNTEDGWQSVNTPTLSKDGYGKYTIDADGVWSYSLNDAKVQTIGGGASVVDTFTATTTDGTTTSVSVTINGTNDAPVLSKVQPTVLPIGNINSNYTINIDTLLAGYTDVDGGELSVTNLSANGGSINGNIFTPDEDFTGTVNLAYDVVDGKGGTVSGAKSFTIGDIKEAVGNLQLAIINDQYMAVDSTTNAITNITYGGVNVGINSYSNWSIIATESTAGGDIQSLWENTNGQYWYSTNTDNGSLVADVATVEVKFKQDINGDRVIGPSLESAGTTTLSLNSNGNYIATNNSVVLDLTYAGNTFNPNTFGGWKVVGAEIAGSDLAMVWKSDAGQFWYSTNTNNGDLVTDITSYEANFSQDFNSDGVIGKPITIIEAVGTTTLLTNSSGNYAVNNGGANIDLLYAGLTFGPSTFDTWQVVGAEIAGADVEMVWKSTGGQFWHSTNTNNGSLVADVTPYEFNFQQDFNQDGFISQIGTAGDDILGGNSTNDLLIGGAGTDTFVLNSTNNGVDLINDFQSSEFLNVSSFGLSTVNLLTVTGAGTPVSNVANQFIFNSTDGALYFDATAGGNDAMKLATLNGVSSLSTSNFILGGQFN
jgi:VCBS repeat-containing protein